MHLSGGKGGKDSFWYLPFGTPAGAGFIIVTHRQQVIYAHAHPLPPIHLQPVKYFKGWTLGFDYQAWAQDKQFHVGDILVFNYPKGVHYVLVVNGSSFANCVKEPIFSGLKVESGQDKLEIRKTGNIWFICGVGQHCENAMKFKITVTDESSSSPAPSPDSSEWSGDSEENWPSAAPSYGYRSRPW
ncbi:hypothetical protein SUGI_0872950 [Cryptomeria japonica]|nr:hypothetical protein SUGI_0872950 [Cryptomeria japonica]